MSLWWPGPAGAGPSWRAFTLTLGAESACRVSGMQISSCEYILQKCCLLKNVKMLGKQCEVPSETSVAKECDTLCSASQRWPLSHGPEPLPGNVQSPLGWPQATLTSGTSCAHRPQRDEAWTGAKEFGMGALWCPAPHPP